MSGSTVASPYWDRPASALRTELGSPEAGLTDAEAAGRLQASGPNSVAEEAAESAWRLAASQFQSPLVLILVFGAAVSLVIRDWVEAAIILLIIAGSALLGFAQEYRASRAISALRSRLALTTRVLRGGIVRTVRADSLVPGDVVELSAGNLVPADGVLVVARDFLVSEASLTGESLPVEKSPGVVPADAPLAQRFNCAFLGTSVRSGSATLLVVRTGRSTVFGAIAGNLRSRAAETEFARGVRRFGALLVRVMIVIVVFVLAVNHLLGRPVMESLLFAVAIAVGLSPELLPAIVSVTLARGARAMAAQGVLVRRLEAIENLGSIDVLCTDKTGTLTEGRITLDEATDPAGIPCPESRHLACLNAALETGIDNPLDAALVAAAQRDGFSTEGWTKIDEIPYDFVRRRLTIVVADREDPACHLIITKGAFANVIAACSTQWHAGTDSPLDAAARARLEEWFRSKGEAGFRVLGLATRRVPARAAYDRDDEAGMCFRGFLLFVDPPRPDAARTLAALSAGGIRVKIITGDNRHVAAHVARAVGLDPARLLTGQVLAGLKDEALWHWVERTDCFVEVDPQQKERIVRALQHNGHAVGYLGDGINDAPALHAADVGISVDGAVDVARESADVVLLAPDLDVVRRGVEEGRRTFANTLKYIGITTSANLGNMVSMALVTPLIPFLPLAAKQILLNNLLSDLPSIAISSDRVDAGEIAAARRWQLPEVRRFMLVFGLLSTVFDLIAFAVLLKGFHVDEATFQTAWFVLSLLTELAVVLVLRSREPLFASRPSALLAWTTAGVAVLTLLVPWLGPRIPVFGFTTLEPALFATLLAIVAGYVAATELTKRIFHRQHAPGRAPPG